MQKGIESNRDWILKQTSQLKSSLLLKLDTSVHTLIYIHIQPRALVVTGQEVTYSILKKEGRRKQMTFKKTGIRYTVYFHLF